MSTIRTRVGRAGFGDYDHFGLRVFADLAGKTSYLGLIAFAITGRRMSREDEALLDDLAVSSHVPEPRVWPMKLARVAASVGRSMPGFLCGAVVLDSDVLGGRVSEDAAAMLVELRAHLAATADTDASIEAFVEQRKRLVGFGVPFREVDERVVSIRACLARRGRLDGPYWMLAERLWRVVREKRGVPVNIIGAASAICLDLGFAPSEIAPMAATLLQPTLLANAVGGAVESPELLRRLPTESIRYVGPAARVSPRAAAAQGDLTRRRGDGREGGRQ